MFKSGSIGLKEQNVVVEVKQYFDPAKVTTNVWMINLLIIVISDGHKYTNSEECNYETLMEWPIS